MGEERNLCPIGGVGYLKQRDRAGCDVMSPDGLTVLYQISWDALAAIERQPLTDGERAFLEARLAHLPQKGETPPTLVEGDIMWCRKKKE